MNLSQKNRIAAIGGFVCGGIFVLLLGDRSETGLVALKTGGQLGVFGWMIGYPLTRVLLACIPFDTIPRAARSGDSERVKRLLDRGEDVDARDFWGNTALAHAARLDDVRMVKLLLDVGADPGIRNLRQKRPGDLSANYRIMWLLDSAPSCQEECQGMICEHCHHFRTRETGLLGERLARNSCQYSGWRNQNTKS